VIYTLLLLTGLIGYAAMMVMGMAHGVGHHGAQAHHSGHAVGHGHGAHPAGAPAHHTPVAHHGTAQQNATNAATLMRLITRGGRKGARLDVAFTLQPVQPRNRAGLTGFLLNGHLNATLVAVLAAVGALGFNLLLVKPLMGFLMRFETTPSEGLEGTVAHTAKAETGFDKQGKGVVTVMIDGQISRMLAHLPQDEGGVLVRKGTNW